MKVVLLENVDKLGSAGEVKNVSDGFARNYLIPKRLAQPATQQALKKVEKQLEDRLKKNEEELKENQKIADQIDKKELTIIRKAKEGKLFGSVSEEDIAKALKKENVNISKENVSLENPIKEVGEYKVKINLEHNIEATLRIFVKEE
ncbi:MAG: 50S ribosomal protein L9 [Patescibacteria group bacterium]